MLLLKAFYGPLAGLSSGVIGFGNCEIISNKLGNEKTVASKHLARHFLGIRPSSGNEELDNAYRLPI